MLCVVLCSLCVVCNVLLVVCDSLRWLFVASCLLCVLFGVRRYLFVGHKSWFAVVVCCSLFVDCCLLFAIYCECCLLRSLFAVVGCALFVVRCLLIVRWS